MLLTGNTTREELVRAPILVARTPARQVPPTCSWEREVLIVAGSAGAGAAIGGLVYDLITRRRD